MEAEVAYDHFCQNSGAVTFSDDNGHFVFDDAPSGDILLYYPWTDGCLSTGEVSRRNWGRWTEQRDGALRPVTPVKGVFAATQFRLGLSENRGGVVLDLSRSVGSVQGRVIDHQGRPVPRCLVLLYYRLSVSTGGPNDKLSSAETHAISASAAWTDAQGRYRIEHVPAGACAIGAYTQSSNLTYADVQVGAGPVDVPDLVLAGP